MQLFTSICWSDWSAPEEESVLTEGSSVFRLGYLYRNPTLYTACEYKRFYIHLLLTHSPPFFTVVNIWNAIKSDKFLMTVHVSNLPFSCSFI